MHDQPSNTVGQLSEREIKEFLGIADLYFERRKSQVGSNSVSGNSLNCNSVLRENSPQRQNNLKSLKEKWIDAVEDMLSLSIEDSNKKEEITEGDLE